MMEGATPNSRIHSVIFIINVPSVTRGWTRSYRQGSYSCENVFYEEAMLFLQVILWLLEGR